MPRGRAARSKPKSKSRASAGTRRTKQSTYSRVRRTPTYTTSMVPMISGGAPVGFRRAYFDAIIFIGDDDTLQIRDGTGAPITWLTQSNLSTDASVNQRQFGLAVDCGFDDLVNSAELRNLFSQYKFGVTEFTITNEQGDSAFTQATASSGAQSPGPPSVYYFYDPTNSEPPSDSAVVLERGNIRYHSLSNNNPLTIKHTLRPQLYSQNGQATPLPIAVLENTPWMKITRGDEDPGNLAPHFGTHFYIRNFGGNYTGARIRITAIQNLYLRYPR